MFIPSSLLNTSLKSILSLLDPVYLHQSYRTCSGVPLISPFASIISTQSKPIQIPSKISMSCLELRSVVIKLYPDSKCLTNIGHEEIQGCF